MDELRELLLSAGLARVADTIERHARPSIRITVHPVDNEETLPRGVSKFGGSPDLPRDFAWPRYDGRPLTFIAQIATEEVAAYDINHLLPPAGVLYFFFSYEMYASDPTKALTDVQRVYYFSGDPSLLHRQTMPSPIPKINPISGDPDSGPYRPCSLMFEQELTLAGYLSHFSASWHSRIHERCGPVPEFTKVERDAYAQLIKDLQGPAYNINRVLGHPDPIQGLDLLPEEVLLLQVDSEDEAAGMMWGDVGRLYWWMNRDDLARRDFYNVKFDEQCC